MLKKFGVIFFSLLLCFSLVACNKNKDGNVKVDLPDTISVNDDGEPILNVYDTNTKQINKMGLEEYLLGVVAGEIYNSWPLEAIKAQAIVARTYTMHFLQNKKSKYDGADISNDITEAQAYNESLINDNIKQAVTETKGLVITNNGNVIPAWFFSNSGGVTTTAKVGLNYLDAEDFTLITTSPENETNSENFSWSATINKSSILSALREMGVNVTTITNFKINSKDDSGRVIEFKVGTSTFSASTFRIKIGSTKLKSCLIDKIIVSDKSVYFEGRGYGHGVGLSQWGAKIMADNGKLANDIIKHYYTNIKIEELS